MSTTQKMHDLTRKLASSYESSDLLKIMMDENIIQFSTEEERETIISFIKQKPYMFIHMLKSDHIYDLTEMLDKT